MGITFNCPAWCQITIFLVRRSNLIFTYPKIINPDGKSFRNSNGKHEPEMKCHFLQISDIGYIIQLKAMLQLSAGINLMYGRIRIFLARPNYGFSTDRSCNVPELLFFPYCCIGDPGRKSCDYELIILTWSPAETLEITLKIDVP